MSNDLVLFSHASPFQDSHQLSERIVCVFDKVLTISQRWKAGGKGGTDIGFGAVVYHCAVVLSLYLEAHPFEVRC